MGPPPGVGDLPFDAGDQRLPGNGFRAGGVDLSEGETDAVVWMAPPFLNFNIQ